MENKKQLIYIDKEQKKPENYDSFEFCDGDTFLRINNRSDGINEDYMISSLHWHNFYELEFVYGGKGRHIFGKTDCKTEDDGKRRLRRITTEKIGACVPHAISAIPEAPKRDKANDGQALPKGDSLFVHFGDCPLREEAYGLEREHKRKIPCVHRDEKQRK